MVNLILPKIEIEALTQNYGRFAISPLEKGFGITLGNGLRRVLLSSLNGAAITSIVVNFGDGTSTTLQGNATSVQHVYTA